MPPILADRIQETTTTTGTGTIALGGAVSGYQSFAAIGNGNTTYYTIVGGAEWEVGIGTYTASGTTLSRSTVLSSSNAGSPVNFSAGTKNVFCGYPAGKAVYRDEAGSVSDLKEATFAITDGAAVDINPANGGLQTWTLGASRSPTAASFAAGQSVTLLIDDGAGYAITWPGVTWLDGASAPTLQTTGYTIIELFKIGATLYGMGRR